MACGTADAEAETTGIADAEAETSGEAGVGTC